MAPVRLSWGPRGCSSTAQPVAVLTGFLMWRLFRLMMLPYAPQCSRSSKEMIRAKWKQQRGVFFRHPTVTWKMVRYLRDMNLKFGIVKVLQEARRTSSTWWLKCYDPFPCFDPSMSRLKKKIRVRSLFPSISRLGERNTTSFSGIAEGPAARFSPSCHLYNRDPGIFLSYPRPREAIWR